MADSPSTPTGTAVPGARLAAPAGVSSYEDGVLRPFAYEPGLWDSTCRRRRRNCGLAVDDGQSAGTMWAALRLVDEKTAWGWLRWHVPEDPHVGPQSPAAIGVLPPAPSATDRLARRWLTRRPSGWRVFGLTLPVALAILLSALAGLRLLAHGVPLDVVLPAALLVPIGAAALPDRLEAACRRTVHIVTGEPQIARLQRLVLLHEQVAQAAACAPVADLEHAARLSHRVLWETAGLLTAPTTAGTDAGMRLTAYERLLSALAAQATQAAKSRQDLERAIVAPTRAPHPTAEKSQTPDASGQELLLPAEVLADAVATLGELTTAHQYATARLTTLARILR